MPRLRYARVSSKETHTNPLYASMVLSWSLTEVVRYSFYAFSLLGSEPAPLAWLRYTLFYVLYPTGASSEAFLMYSTLPHPAWGVALGTGWDALHTYVRDALFVVWWPGTYPPHLYAFVVDPRPCPASPDDDEEGEEGAPLEKKGPQVESPPGLGRCGR